MGYPGAGLEIDAIQRATPTSPVVRLDPRPRGDLAPIYEHSVVHNDARSMAIQSGILAPAPHLYPGPPRLGVVATILKPRPTITPKTTAGIVNTKLEASARPACLYRPAPDSALGTKSVVKRIYAVTPIATPTIK